MITRVTLSTDFQNVSIYYTGTKIVFSRTVLNSFKESVIKRIAFRVMPGIRFLEDKEYTSLMKAETILDELTNLY